MSYIVRKTYGQESLYAGDSKYFGPYDDYETAGQSALWMDKHYPLDDHYVEYLNPASSGKR